MQTKQEKQGKQEKQEKQASTSSPFHAGEHMVQQRLGVTEVENWARKVVRDHMPEQHRQFYTELPFIVAAARDAQERPWVTLLEGNAAPVDNTSVQVPHQFIDSPDPRHLVLHSRPAEGDALEHAFLPQADVGLLGIELSSRRRNRVNGRVAGHTADGITFQVDQSFGNCPQYISERTWQRVPRSTTGTARRSDQLTPVQMDWVRSADTFFIASGYRGVGASATYGMDASHRGGDPGFVRVLDAGCLQFPDYAGNNHFNTIGNLVLDARAGLLFVDFTRGSLLQVSGSIEIDWDSPALHQFPGARRLLTLKIAAVVELPEVLGLRWHTPVQDGQSLRLLDKRRESADVTSFLFASADGQLPQSFVAGQHLPLAVATADGVVARRTYSLSNRPSDPYYRISVKREPQGEVSRFLHDALQPGSVVHADAPAGEFVLPEDDKPVVLLSAGVGVTPMVSMLHAAVSFSSERPVWFVHAARDGEHHPLGGEVRRLADAHKQVSVQVAYSQPGHNDRIGHHYDFAGRIDQQLISNLVAQVQCMDARYFMCGPSGFMAQMQTYLSEAGVAPAQVHYENFGAAGGA